MDDRDDFENVEKWVIPFGKSQASLRDIALTDGGIYYLKQFAIYQKGSTASHVVEIYLSKQINGVKKCQPQA